MPVSLRLNSARNTPGARLSEARDVLVRAAPGLQVAVVGVSRVAVVAEGDGVLVCGLDSAQSVRGVVAGAAPRRYATLAAAAPFALAFYLAGTPEHAERWALLFGFVAVIFPLLHVLGVVGPLDETAPRIVRGNQPVGAGQAVARRLRNRSPARGSQHQRSRQATDATSKPQAAAALIRWTGHARRCCRSLFRRRGNLQPAIDGARRLL